MSLRRLKAVSGKNHDRPETKAILCLADFPGLADLLEAVVGAGPRRVAGGPLNKIEAVVVLEIGPRDFHDAAGPDFYAVFIKHHFSFPFCPAIIRPGGAVPGDGPGGRFGLHFGEVFKGGVTGCPKPGLLDYAGGRDECPGFGGVVGVFEDTLLEKITDGPHDTKTNLLVVAPHLAEATVIITLFHEFHFISLSRLPSSAPGGDLRRTARGPFRLILDTSTNQEIL